MIRKLLILGSSLLLCLLLTKSANALTLIDDPTHSLLRGDSLKQELVRLDNQGVNTKVVLVDDIKFCNALSVEDCTFKLYKEWANEENNIVFLVSKADKKAYMVVSRQLRYPLSSDIISKDIHQGSPYFKIGDYDQALHEVFSAVIPQVESYNQTMGIWLLIVGGLLLVIFITGLFLPWSGGYYSSTTIIDNSSSSSDSGSWGSGGGDSW